MRLDETPVSSTVQQRNPQELLAGELAVGGRTPSSLRDRITNLEEREKNSMRF
jgi:hypothetical protein